MRILKAERLSTHRQLSFLRLIHSADDFYQNRFACAVFLNQRVRLAWMDTKVYTPENINPLNDLLILFACTTGVSFPIGSSYQKSDNHKNVYSLSHFFE
jgi:hypothetical protein